MSIKMKAKGRISQIALNQRKAKKGTGSKFDAKPYVKDGATEEEILVLKDCFDAFDNDQSGTLDVEELKKSIQDMNLDDSAERLMKLVEKVDENHDNVLDFGEFLHWIGAYKTPIEEEETVQNLFKDFLPNGKGETIKVEDFMRIVNEIGARFCVKLLNFNRYTEYELKEMIELADLDKDGGINLEEFADVVTKNYNMG